MIEVGGRKASKRRQKWSRNFTDEEVGVGWMEDGPGRGSRITKSLEL